MVFAEGSFKEHETGLEGHCGPFCNLVCALCGRKICNSKVDIFYHLAKDELPGVAGTVEFLVVSRTDRFLIPGNVAEALYFIEVEVCTEESCKSLIFNADSLVLAVGQELQKGVDVAQRAPTPTAA